MIAVPRAAPADLLALTKPRITLLVIATVAAGFLLAPNAVPGTGISPAARWLLLVHTLIGSALVAGGTNALNQLVERDVDALMRRTANRPLPAARLSVMEAGVFAWGISIAGVTYLGLLVNWTTAVIAALTLVSYVAVYTPLKRRTTLATLVGAVPGALPIVGGWTANGGSLDAAALALFSVMFLWQLPHFLALAWIFREDYRRAGLQMLSIADEDGTITMRQAALGALALIPAGIAPAVFGVAGVLYALGGLVLSSTFAFIAWQAARSRSAFGAKRVFFASLVYLPALLGLMIADRLT
jgi:protoheme IX farnesyltransferase